MIRCECLDVDVWIGGHDLLLGSLRIVLLEDKVAKSARQRQVSVHSVELDPSAGGQNALRLQLIVGLVIVRQVLHSAAHARDCSRVANVAL